MLPFKPVAIVKTPIHFLSVKSRYIPFKSSAVPQRAAGNAQLTLKMPSAHFSSFQCILISVAQIINFLTDFMMMDPTSKTRSFTRSASMFLRHDSSVTVPPPPMPPHVFCGLRGPPSWTWHEWNRRLSLGRPWAAVTLSRWCVSGDRGGCSAGRGLKPKFC